MISAIDRLGHGSRMFASVQDQEKDQQQTIEVSAKSPKCLNSLSAASAALCLLSSDVANAAGPDWGKIFWEQHSFLSERFVIIHKELTFYLLCTMTGSLDRNFRRKDWLAFTSSYDVWNARVDRIHSPFGI
jgi:hypothetical protein